MYLRRNNKTRVEVSFDEPLNIDWDGNELLLSDILGTDNDMIYKYIEDEVDRELLEKAMKRLSQREQCIIKLRFGLNGELKRHKRGLQTCLAFHNHIFHDLKKDNKAAKKRNGAHDVI